VRANLLFLWRDQKCCQPFHTGVSLHSHTMHSRESLAFIPQYMRDIPLVPRQLRRQEQRYQEMTGKPLDYNRGHWTPPLPPLEAVELETRQIEEKLSLGALVSLTDHDNIEAGYELQKGSEQRAVPISVEWKVPIGPTYLHIGIHNLPPGQARQIFENLKSYTRNPCPKVLPGLLELLNGYEQTLIVLNHPLWDQSGIGREPHLAVVRELLDDAGQWIHAIELNGLRSWAENDAVMDLASASNLPLISGGDRHGCQPNAILNLTNARSFAEFVSEVRGGRSDILFMPQYRKALQSRVLAELCDVLRDHPQLNGRKRWSDRVFYYRTPEEIVPLSKVWNGHEPKMVKYFVGAIRVVETTRLPDILGFCLSGHR
jgi:hypothetical protein